MIMHVCIEKGAYQLVHPSCRWAPQCHYRLGPASQLAFVAVARLGRSLSYRRSQLRRVPTTHTHSQVHVSAYIGAYHRRVRVQGDVSHYNHVWKFGLNAFDSTRHKAFGIIRLRAHIVFQMRWHFREKGERLHTQPVKQHTHNELCACTQFPSLLNLLHWFLDFLHHGI